MGCSSLPLCITQHTLKHPYILSLTRLNLPEVPLPIQGHSGFVSMFLGGEPIQRSPVETCPISLALQWPLLPPPPAPASTAGLPDGGGYVGCLGFLSSCSPSIHCRLALASPSRLTSPPSNIQRGHPPPHRNLPSVALCAHPPASTAAATQFPWLSLLSVTFSVEGVFKA